MKYPNPTFLQKAESIRHTRRNRTIIILSVLIVLTLLVIFVAKIAAMQEKYKESFPHLVGAATSTTTTTESSEEESETSEATETEETTTETYLAPIVIETEATTTTDPNVTTTQNNNADPFVEEDNVYFRTSHPLQTITHEERDVLLDDLKENLERYIGNAEGARVCLRYINLASNEELAVNELDPIIPASTFNLPISIIYWERVALGTINTDRLVTYVGDLDPGNSSYIAANYQPGKSFYLRTCANLAIANNDNLAAGYILNSVHGLDAVNPYILDMSSLIDYTQSVTYQDYSGMTQRGAGRSSVYDLANFAEYLYYGYINSPSTYQGLINDMAYSQVPTAYTSAFGEDALILHVAGRNVDTCSYTDLAIIDSEEPIILCISCECSDENQASVIQADLATYVARFISECHS